MCVWCLLCSLLGVFIDCQCLLTSTNISLALALHTSSKWLACCHLLALCYISLELYCLATLHYLQCSTDTVYHRYGAPWIRCPTDTVPHGYGAPWIRCPTDTVPHRYSAPRIQCTTDTVQHRYSCSINLSISWTAHTHTHTHTHTPF